MHEDSTPHPGGPKQMLLRYPCLVGIDPLCRQGDPGTAPVQCPPDASAASVLLDSTLPAAKVVECASIPARSAILYSLRAAAIHQPAFPLILTTVWHHRVVLLQHVRARSLLHASATASPGKRYT